jgi:hypothetical protein
VEIKCSLENLTANGKILQPGFLRPGGQEDRACNKKASHSPLTAPCTWGFSLAPPRFTTFIFQLSLAKSAALKADLRDLPSISPALEPGKQKLLIPKAIRALEGKNISPQQICQDENLLLSPCQVHFPTNKLWG